MNLAVTKYPAREKWITSRSNYAFFLFDPPVGSFELFHLVGDYLSSNVPWYRLLIVQSFIILSTCEASLRQWLPGTVERPDSA